MEHSGISGLQEAARAETGLNEGGRAQMWAQEI